jgi:hypothetical protein
VRLWVSNDAKQQTAKMRTLFAIQSSSSSSRLRLACQCRGNQPSQSSQNSQREPKETILHVKKGKRDTYQRQRRAKEPGYSKNVQVDERKNSRGANAEVVFHRCRESRDALFQADNAVTPASSFHD